jgi:hypothetical protein
VGTGRGRGPVSDGDLPEDIPVLTQSGARWRVRLDSAGTTAGYVATRTGVPPLTQSGARRTAGIRPQRGIRRRGTG